jgi:hypothetical protein
MTEVRKLSVIDAVIESAKANPDEWARYCELAAKLIPGDMSPEDKARVMLKRRFS